MFKEYKMPEIVPVWHPSACIPREEVITGKLTDAELALRLSTIVRGEAKPPYNTPESFLKATHLTKNMKIILENVFGRLSGTKKDVNPIIVLDVGFGGGKTHTMATLYYVAKYGHNKEVSRLVGDMIVPKNIKIVAIGGEDYTEEGIIRDGRQIKTIWGDFFWQLGKYEKYMTKDLETITPSIDEIKEAIEDSPTLILLDELPTYLKTVSMKKNMLDKTVQWIQRLVLAVSEVENAVLVVAIAEDVYKQEAEKVKTAIIEKVKEAMAEARAHIARKETVYVPITEEDVVHILKKRLFDSINQLVAKQVAQAYHELYKSLPVIEELKTSQYRDLIEEYYPFHPHLIKVLYERLATLDRFQRTRGALRLLSRTIRRIWKQKEPDAILIHPFHIDLADNDILTDLTTHIGEEKLRNAVEADIWKGDGTATAEQLDEQAKENWGAPLVRRACNTIYLYSLATGKEGDRGIRSDVLISLLVTPVRREHFMKIRDIVLDYLSDQFHYIDKQGERYVFVREPTPIRIIDLLARDITEEEVLKIIKEKLMNELFKRTRESPTWINIEFFPLTPSKLQDDTPLIQVAILNPSIHVIKDKEIPDDVKQFIEYSDDHQQRPRKYTNSTFLLVASEDMLEPVRLVARKIQAARMVKEDPMRYQIPKDRKADIEEYLARQEKLLYDYIRAAFMNIIYCHKDDIKMYQVRDGSGYGSSVSGYEMLKHILTNVIDRVTERMDPEYIQNYVWPADATSVTTQDLYEWFFRKPGVKIPADKEVYIRSIMDGIKQGIWALDINGKIYDKDNPPKVIVINNKTELLTPEEAEIRKRKQLSLPPSPPTPSLGEVSEVKEGKVWSISLGDSKAEILASDLERKKRIDRFTSVYRAVIKTSIPDASLIQELRSIITRYMPERNLRIKLKGALSRSRAPYYSVTFEVDKETSQKEEGRSLLENLWKLKGAESVELELELEWSQPTTPEQLISIIRTLKSDLLISLQAEVGRQ
jgi:6-pyruvoyl-tetrahydropterin synthase